MANLPPWHLWGTDVTIIVPNTGAAPPAQQLAKVSYKRPETWRFLFFATLVDDGNSGAGIGSSLFVAFDLYLGVGRTAYTFTPASPLTGGFANLGFLVGASSGAKAWTTLGQSQRATSNDLATPITTPIDMIVAQDINVQARTVYLPGGNTATVSVGAFFAPVVHVRPDWHAGPRDPFDPFAGGEVGGH